MRTFQHRELPNIFIEAEQVQQDTYAPMAVELNAHVVKEVNKETGEEFIGLNVLTSHGWVRASEGCWVVKSAVGVFVLTPTHFGQKYEEVKPEAANHVDLFAARGGKINNQNQEDRTHGGTSNDE